VLVAGSIDRVDIELRRTRRQVPRASRPDAATGDRWYLMKNVPLMRLTYQMRLLACLAQQNAARLVVVLPSGTRLSADMQVFAHVNSVTIERAKT
jgi:hypothetical protein